MNFGKFHGFGNDYLVFRGEDLANVASLNDFARRVCERHYGIGADGIAVVSVSTDETADFAVRIFNPDGSEAGFSGNGTRCAVAFLHYEKIWAAENVRLSLSSGIKKYRLIETIAAGRYIFEAEIGKPKFRPVEIPMLADEKLEKIVEFPLALQNETVKITAVNVGNPVCAVFVENFDALDWRKIGREIENHAHFPERTNAVFVKIADRNNIEVRIWERGAGETLASGTCTTAAAIAACINGRTARSVAVHSEGGTVAVQWREADDEIVMQGRADFVFKGEWLVNDSN